MSYPTGHQQPPDHGDRPNQRPSFDRPSLFAGMEDDDGPEDTQRVRILSTLESTRHATKPRRTKGGRPSGQERVRSRWLQIGLWSVMSVGVLALFAGFILVIQDGKPAVLHALPVATAPTMPALAGKMRQASLDAVLPTSAEPAVIETTARAETATLTTTTAAPTAAPPPRPMALALTNDQPRASTAPSTLIKQPVAPTAKPVKAASSSSKPQDEDVALLEAMFAHTGRKTPSKPASPQH